MIGRAPYGHSSVLSAILAAERRGSQPAGEAPSIGSAGAARSPRSLGDELEPRAYHPEPDLDQDVRRPFPGVA